jgi:hypothetical protein
LNRNNIVMTNDTHGGRRGWIQEFVFMVKKCFRNILFYFKLIFYIFNCFDILMLEIKYVLF